MARTDQENFDLSVPAEVAQTEAGAHTLAGAGAGVELSAADAYGLAGESKSQARLVLSRFFHQRMAIIGLCVFAGLGIASVLVFPQVFFPFADRLDGPCFVGQVPQQHSTGITGIHLSHGQHPIGLGGQLEMTSGDSRPSGEDNDVNGHVR